MLNEVPLIVYSRSPVGAYWIIGRLDGVADTVSGQVNAVRIFVSAP